MTEMAKSFKNTNLINKIGDEATKSFINAVAEK
jgi:hypothetical protein